MITGQPNQVKNILYGPYYARLCKTVKTVGDLVELSNVEIPKKRQELISSDINSDWYSSLYYYPNEAKVYYDAHKSLGGYKGPAFTKKLLFDFDSKKDVELARKDAIKLLERLQDNGIDVANSCRVFFSGSKGFHIEVLTNKEFTPEELKPICSELASGLDTFDTSVYNITRLIRLVNTKHQVTGLYKIEILPDDLISKSIDDIKELAKSPVTLPEFEIKPIINLDFIQKIKVKPPTPVIVDNEDIIRGIDTIDFSKMPKGMPRCIYGLSHGIMQSGNGERNRVFLRLASYYRNQGLTKEVCLHTLMGIAKENSKLYPEYDAYTEDELRNTVISSVYSQNWKQIPDAVGTDETNELLKKYCEIIGKHTEKLCCLHNKANNMQNVVQIGDVFDRFSAFAQNFDKNTVKTGIDFIDTNMNISVGTTSLLVGAAGCHRKGEKILMFNGSTKKVEDIKVGELLMGPDSKPRRVLQLKRGSEEMYAITFNRGKTPKNKPKYFNANHKLHFLDSQGGDKKDRIVQMTIKEFIKDYPEYRKERCFFLRQDIEYKEKQLNIDPYILGMWLGDGHTNSPRFTFQDRELIVSLEEYAAKIKETFKIQNSPNRCSNYSVVGSGKLLNSLRSYNLISNKHIPHEYKTSSKKQRLSLLAGIIDTDGHVYNNCVEVVQKKERLALDIQSLCFSLGFQATLKKVEKTCTNAIPPKTGIYYRINISGDLGEIPTKILRKKLFIRKQIKNVNRLSFKIEKVSDNEDYYGFTVDKDNLYLDDDYLIIRNSGKTTLGLNIMENANALGQHTMFFSMDMHMNLVYLKLAQKITNYSQKQLLEIFKTRDKFKMQRIKEQIAERYGKTYFDFSSILSLDQMRDKLLDMEQKTGNKIKLVMVDYASRIDSNKGDAYSNARFNAIKSVEVANVTDAAWTIISQISRNTGDGSTPIRTKRAAKDSGDWEESATNVITCWRPFMGDFERDDVMRLYLAKNRMGKELEEVLRWDGAKGLIRDMTFEEKAIYNEMVGPEAEKNYLKERYAAKSGGFNNN